MHRNPACATTLNFLHCWSPHKTLVAQQCTESVVSHCCSCRIRIVWCAMPSSSLVHYWTVVYEVWAIRCVHSIDSLARTLLHGAVEVTPCDCGCGVVAVALWNCAAALWLWHNGCGIAAMALWHSEVEHIEEIRVIYYMKASQPTCATIQICCNVWSVTDKLIYASTAHPHTRSERSTIFNKQVTSYCVTFE